MIRFCIHIAVLCLPFVSVQAAEIQLTSDPRNHSLDNNDNYSPDDQWLVYDTRTDDGGIRMGKTIEKVHVRTKEIVTIYRAPDATDSGPGVGAASYHPQANSVVFIHGLLNHTAERPYELWRRFGMIVHEAAPNMTVTTDARDVVAPFTAGALRGGTHRHEFSADGGWIGFTYNDALMADRGEKFNLRTIGVTQLDKPVVITGTVDGSSFHGVGTSALVVRVTPNPRPGSDEISRAAWDSWIGTQGYRKPNGRLQRARAFLGTVYSLDGRDVPELYVVDIPDDITQPGPDGPLEGTAEQMPMPPVGARQRRLTNTTDKPYPGFSGNVRSSPDGSMLACLAKDDQGVDQLILASSVDGSYSALTSLKTPVESDARWHPDGTHVIFSCDNSVMVANVKDGSIRRLTERTEEPPFALVWSRGGTTIAWNRLVKDVDSGQSFAQIFLLTLTPDMLP